MCGIFFSISTIEHVLPSVENQELLRSRGPDSTGLSKIACGDLFLTFWSTVLSMRGEALTSQPVCSYHTNCHIIDSILCWNGEAWQINSSIAPMPLVNDTLIVAALLQDKRSVIQSARTVVNRLSCIAGPYAFVFYDAMTQTIYYGRDFLGRRSLLWAISPNGDFLLSSVADRADGLHWQEVQANGIYSVNLRECNNAILSMGPDYPWHTDRTLTTRHEFPVVDSAGFHASVIPSLTLAAREPDPSRQTPTLSQDSEAVAELQQHLTASLVSRVQDIPPRFFGGTKMLGPKLAILFSGGLDCTVLARMVHDVYEENASVDLLNVAFENPRLQLEGDKGNDIYERCPDRITGRASWQELREVCPTRTWNFVAVNVPLSETLKHRKQVIVLMQPHDTEMDLSIALALYFAARGQGVSAKSSNEPEVDYKTPARVLLSGLGADELFAGYTRHATAYKRNGVDGLHDELQLDVSRLGQRNLGRDDRVMSHWGKEVRFPYLDENFVHWALSKRLEEKCGFMEPSSVPKDSLTSSSEMLEPGKKVLRCLAWKLGMFRVAREGKRAIQFGARSAKMSTRKTKGTATVE